MYNASVPNQPTKHRQKTTERKRRRRNQRQQQWDIWEHLWSEARWGYLVWAQEALSHSSMQTSKRWQPPRVESRRVNRYCRPIHSFWRTGKASGTSVVIHIQEAKWDWEYHKGRTQDELLRVPRFCVWGSKFSKEPAAPDTWNPNFEVFLNGVLSKLNR